MFRSCMALQRLGLLLCMKWNPFKALSPGMMWCGFFFFFFKDHPNYLMRVGEGKTRKELRGNFKNLGKRRQLWQTTPVVFERWLSMILASWCLHPWTILSSGYGTCLLLTSGKWSRWWDAITMITLRLHLAC